MSTLSQFELAEQLDGGAKQYPLSTSLPLLQHLSSEQRQQFVQFGTGPQQALPFECLHHAFAQKVATQGDEIALIDGQRKLSYRQLDQAANRLAAKLQSMGVHRGDTVGLFLHRNISMVVGMLACFKAGAAYAPQHVKVCPLEQLQYACDCAKITVVLTLDEYKQPLNDLSAELLPIDNFLTTADEGLELTPVKSDGNTTAFVLFTSGTTGKPNGVQVSHRNSSNILLTAPGHLDIKRGTRVSQLLSISFDMAEWEIWGCLCNGGTLIIRGQSIQEAAEQAHVIIATPSVLASIDRKRCGLVQKAIVAGEPCPENLAQAWSEQCDFYNSCGPTETTIINTAVLYEKGKPLSIGRPTPNNTVYVLDDDLKPLPIGEVGMMWGGGDCVSQGYINNDTLNKTRYREDPFLGGGRRMFRTGDLGRWNEYGELEHFGRADDQVKIRGFRVELDSVSRVIEQLDGVKRALTLKYDNRHLVAFITGAEHSTEVVQEKVKSKLPYYCAPVRAFYLERFPQTPRGKIEKRELMALAQQELAQQALGEQD